MNCCDGSCELFLVKVVTCLGGTLRGQNARNLRLLLLLTGYIACVTAGWSVVGYLDDNLDRLIISDVIQLDCA